MISTHSKVFIRILPILLFTFAGCSPDPSDSDTDSHTDTDTDTDTETDTDTDSDTNELTGTYYSQEITENDETVTLVPDTLLKLELYPYNEQYYYHYQSFIFRAHGGCNSLYGTYQIVDNAMVVLDSFIETQNECEESLHEQDDWYFGFLTTSPTLSLSGDELELDNGGIYIRFLSEEQVTPDMDLAGRTWLIDAIREGQLVMSAMGETMGTLLFEESGNLSFNTGCNDGNATYVVEGDILTLSNVASDDAACPDSDAQYVEEVILKTLAEGVPIDWDIDVTRLDLRNGDYGVDATSLE